MVTCLYSFAEVYIVMKGSGLLLFVVVVVL